MPTIPHPPPLAAEGREGAARAASRLSAASAPCELKPSRLITPWSASSRNSRGRGLPGCGSGVMVPTSTKPKPTRSRASGTSAFLSKPAAMPTGFGKLSPNTRSASRLSSRGAGGSGANFSILIASPWASSGSSARRNGRARRSSKPITVPAPEKPAGRRSRRAAAAPSAPPTAAARRRDAETDRRRGSAPISAPAPSASPSTATSIKSHCPAKCLAAVSATCAAVEKWMKPSR